MAARPLPRTSAVWPHPASPPRKRTRSSAGGKRRGAKVVQGDADGNDDDELAGTAGDSAPNHDAPKARRRSARADMPVVCQVLCARTTSHVYGRQGWITIFRWRKFSDCSAFCARSYAHKTNAGAQQDSRCIDLSRCRSAILVPEMHSLIALVLVAALPALTVGAYDETAAKRYASWQAAAYCPGPQVVSWTCKQCSPTLPLTHVTYIANDTSTIYGLVGVYEPALEVVIAFRGSVGTLDWLEDFDFTLVPAALTINASCPGCELSKGFSVDTWATVRAQTLAAARSALAAFPGSRLVFLGHSLGAAIAEVATFDFMAAGLPTKTHVSFGTPRAGNTAWARAWYAAAEVAMPSAHFRVVHALDPVPRLPPAIIFGYEHPPQEIWYNTASSSYTACNATYGEDPHCSDGDLPLDPQDHDKYLNVTLGTSQC